MVTRTVLTTVLLMAGTLLPRISPAQIRDRRVVCVDLSASGFADGSPTHPFQTVIEGVLDVSAQGLVLIQGGSYPEKMILNKAMQLRSVASTVTIGQGVVSPFLDCAPGAGPSADEDGDGILDSCEQALAEQYAPIIYHSSDESNLPTSVDWFLQKTSLWFYDDGCWPDAHTFIVSSPSQEQLLGWSAAGGCGSTDTVYSNGTRSNSKQRTFYLKDLAETYRGGSLDTRDWITYYHAYPTTLGGVTIQYWRFYAYNDAVNNHGGDWEGIHVVLDQNLQPLRVGLLGHSSIEYVLPSQLQWEGSHPRIFSEGGGHASRATGDDIFARDCMGLGSHIDPENPCTFIRQETWTTGQVQWCPNCAVPYGNGHVTPSGGLLNLGAKIGPMNNQVFIQYSGLWGSPGTFNGTSGYWGPAFNETSMKPDGFVTAWGAEMASDRVNITRECYPTATTR